MSPRKERMKAIIRAIVDRIEVWENTKKFFKINDSQTPLPNSREEQYEPESIFRLSARSIDLGSSEADWPTIVHKLGLGHYKTDFAIGFEK